MTPAPDSMVERVKASIAALLPAERPDYVAEVARAAIEAMREPTDQMIHAGWGGQTDSEVARQITLSVWHAMVDKALS